MNKCDIEKELEMDEEMMWLKLGARSKSSLGTDTRGRHMASDAGKVEAWQLWTDSQILPLLKVEGSPFIWEGAIVSDQLVFIRSRKTSEGGS